MIFKKRRIELEYKRNNFWSQNVNSTTVVIKDRKYKVSRSNNQIIIKRKINDFWDLVGFIPFKRIGIAKGELQNVGSVIKLNLVIGINQFVKLLFVASIILVGCLIIGIMTQDFISGLIFLFVMLLITCFQYLILSYGLNEFYSDLENDIIYFK